MTVRSDQSDEYKQYIASAAWRKRRTLLLKERGNRCERCGIFRFGRGELQIHHLTYERLGAERKDDLQVVCCFCHDAADRERAEKTATRNAESLWNARVDGWARAKYGDDWGNWYQGDVDAEFEEWLEDEG